MSDETQHGTFDNATAKFTNCHLETQPKTMLTVATPASAPVRVVGPPELVIAERDALEAVLRDIAVAWQDEDQGDLLGLLFVEHGMDRAQEVMAVLRRLGKWTGRP